MRATRLTSSPVIAAGLVAVSALLISLFAWIGTASATPSTSVVINEVYGGGGNSGAPYSNDFIELRNFSSTAVDLSDYSVQYASATSTGSWTVTPLQNSIPAGGLYLIQEAAGMTPSASLPTPDATGTINLSATNGKVALVDNQTALDGQSPTAGVVDLVGYGTANDSETSPAPALTNTTSAQRPGTATADTDDNANDFIAAAPTPGATNASSGGTAPAACTAPSSTTVEDITGDTWLSPLDGASVSCVPGIVTGLRTSGGSKGFWIQQVTAIDSDPATSEGVFVYTSSVPSGVAVGDSVLVSGTVSNYDPEGNRSTTTTSDLTVTEIGSPTTVVLSQDNPLPAPIVIGPDTVPAAYAPDLSSTGDNDIEDTPITPTRSALDYYRSIEGMRAEVDNARVVGPSAVFGSGTSQDSESYVTTKPDEAETYRGGTELLAENAMPAGLLEIVPNDGSDPAVSVGDVLTGPVIGEVDYSNYGGFLLGTAPITAVDRTNEVTPTVVAPAASDQLSIATYNVENLAPSDPDSKFTALGQDLVTNLGTPDIVAVEEVQDNSGATDDGTVSATDTISKLEAAITAAGGPAYQSEEIDPVNDQDGGEPGGNIRVVYLFNPAVVSFVPGTDGAGDATTATAVTTVNGQPALTLSPGRIDPTNSAWASSRKPLAGEFMFQGKPVFVIANHFVAKLGDQDQDGRYQYPAQSSAVQRAAQATEVHNFTQQILNVNPNANVVVLGDLNDYQFSPALKTLETGTADGSGPSILQDLITTLPVNQQYTYDYEGVSEVLDHILISPALQGNADYHVVHIKSEFAGQVSDHDPQVVDLTVPTPAVTTTSTPSTTTSTPAPATTSTPTPTTTVVPPSIQPVAVQFVTAAVLAGNAKVSVVTTKVTASCLATSSRLAVRYTDAVVAQSKRTKLTFVKATISLGGKLRAVTRRKSAAFSLSLSGLKAGTYTLAVVTTYHYRVGKLTRTFTKTERVKKQVC